MGKRKGVSKRLGGYRGAVFSDHNQTAYESLLERRGWLNGRLLAEGVGQISLEVGGCATLEERWEKRDGRTPKRLNTPAPTILSERGKKKQKKGGPFAKHS